MANHSPQKHEPRKRDSVFHILNPSILAAVIGAIIPGLAAAAEPDSLPDIRSIATDLTIPAISDGDPAPGKRVAQVAPEYEGTAVHHVLYLPRDWQPGRQYPVIVEYAGNGPYSNKYGDISTGEVEGSKMGYGLSGGEGFIWLCLPYVNTVEKRNQTQWWGDTKATVEYAKKTIRRVCEKYGGDTSAIVLAGFSRGSIACNFIGLHDDEIADIWLAFMPYSHYDGVKAWDYPGSGREAAIERLKRLRGRASFLTHERSIEDTRDYLASTGIEAPFTLRALAFRNHNDGWTLRDVPERREARAWLRRVLKERPGTYSVRGRVFDPNRKPLGGVRIESGAHHWTFTGPDGSYSLKGLLPSKRTVHASGPGLQFEPSERVIELGADRGGIDFAAATVQ